MMMRILRSPKFTSVVLLASTMITVAVTDARAIAQEQPPYRCEGFSAPTGGQLSSMVTTKSGAVWFDDASENRLVRVAPDRTNRAFVPVDATTGTLSGITLAADGAVWYSKNTSHRMGRFPADGGKGVEYELPAPNVFTGAIAGAPDGRIWYVDPVANKVGSMTGDGTVATYDAPVIGGAPADPASIATSADDSAWVTSIGHNAVYRVDPATGAFTRYDIATPNAQPGAIALGADGNMWFTMTAVNEIGRIAPDGTITEYPEKLVGLGSIARGPDGAIWYSSRQGVGRIDTGTGRFETFACDGYGGITTGPDGHVWVQGSAHIFIVRARDETSRARITATSSSTSPSSSSGIETVAAARVKALVDAAPGRVLVEYSSEDAGCGYCILGNRHFADVTDRSGNVKYLRVLYSPWTSANRDARAKLTGLPSFILYDKGSIVKRLDHDASPDGLRETFGL